MYSCSYNLYHLVNRINIIHPVSNIIIHININKASIDETIVITWCDTEPSREKYSVIDNNI